LALAETHAGAFEYGLVNKAFPWFRTENRYTFQNFYHPYVCAFVKELNRHGVDGLLQRKIQTHPHLFLPRPPSGTALKPLDFEKTYEPHTVSHPIVAKPYPAENVDFKSGGYSLYNWELFFHTPLMIADRLSQNQRFEEAQKWFHYIFDPTDTSGLSMPKRYWITKPFHRKTDKKYQKEHIPNLLRLLATRGNAAAYAALTPDERKELEGLEDQVSEWRKDPFEPHLIARLRTTAYQKTVVMKYIDNLIAWGDQLFRRDTLESINEASQLYILAAELLGKRPEEIPRRAIPTVHTYNTLEPKLGAFSNALMQIEEFVQPSTSLGTVSSGSEPPPTLPAMLYFCVPKNSKLLGYWDTVAGRLFKIRHCMNIEGVVRQLPLFAPPIEPGLLVKAAAAGVDISSVLSDINAALPHYRFNVMAQKATELCAEVKSLGAALLAALEKRDAEELALLRTRHEADLLKRVEQIRKDQIEESKESLAALRKSRDVAIGRYVHYQKLLGVQSPQIPAEGEAIPEHPPSPHVSIKEEGGIKMIPLEKEELGKLAESNTMQQLAWGIDTLKNIAFMFPAIKMAFLGVGAEHGGIHVGFGLDAMASYFRGRSADLSYQGSHSARLSKIAMRAHDWTLQSNSAARDIMQIDKQILAAEIRKAITERELDNHRKQIEQSKEVETFLRDKYTNRELYNWMVGQISGIYFQTYQLAYDVAKRAERAYRHELGLRDSNFIQFGYWDSLKKGLLAGESLFHDIKRIEVAYLEQNKREYEITKHISLAQLDPVALVRLRQTGKCFISIPEALFDLDYPGHYMRRIKSVGVTIPCITGPYTAVPCTLTLTRSSVRHSNTLLGNKYTREDNDPRFTDSVGAIESIVTSSGQEDSGLFETNLRDERYLPFEGAGTISQWNIELPASFRSFDYDTISDVLLHFRYTAREAGSALKQQAIVELEDAVNTIAKAEGEQGFARLFSARHEFSSEWHRFLHPPAAATGDQTLTLALNNERFPYIFQDRAITIDRIELFLKVESGFAKTHNESTLKLSLEEGTAASNNNNKLSIAASQGLLQAEKSPVGSPGDWTLTAWLEPVADGPHQRLDANAIEDLVIVCHFSI
jgi:Tc toxin complex TcA C-terminal TcB-binding domain